MEKNCSAWGLTRFSVLLQQNLSFCRRTADLQGARRGETVCPDNRSVSKQQNSTRFQSNASKRVANTSWTSISGRKESKHLMSVWWSHENSLHVITLWADVEEWTHWLVNTWILSARAPFDFYASTSNRMTSSALSRIPNYSSMTRRNVGFLPGYPLHSFPFRSKFTFSEIKTKVTLLSTCGFSPQEI